MSTSAAAASPAPQQSRGASHIFLWPFALKKKNLPLALEKESVNQNHKTLSRPCKIRFDEI
jgi:hypothetical protein